MQVKVRTTDPLTSWDAWRQNIPKQARQKRLIAEGLWLEGHKGLNCDELCNYTGMRWNSVSTRLSQMIREGLVEDTGVVRNGQRVVRLVL